MAGSAAQARPDRPLLQAIKGDMRKPGLSYSQSHFAHIHLLVAQHHPPSHLAAALQVAERCARLVCRPRLNRDRRNFASPNESEKLLQILERAHIRALDVIILNGNSTVE